MAIDLKNYVPALMQGANIGVNVDLTDIVDNNGNEVIEIDGVASAVNYLRVTNAATADPILLSCQGTADRGFEFHNDQSEQMLILTPVASAVNEITITNAATGTNPVISCTGEANTGIDFENSEGEEILILDSVASSVNEITVRSAATGNKPILAATGEADNGIEFHNDQAEEILILQSAATSVNEVTITSAATGAAPSVAPTGGDTNIDISIIGKGTGGVLMKPASEIVTATNVITAAESGKVFFLNSATEFASTLPAPAQGLHYKFIVTAAPSGASYTIGTNGGANIIEGAAEVANSAVAAVNEDTITFTDGAAAVGDWVEVVSDGTSWFVSGHGVAATAVAFTAT